MILVATAGVALFASMILEARLAVRHERMQQAAGAIEPAGDVYRVMQIAYPAAFLAMLGEGGMRAVPFDAVAATGLVLFAAAKGLKYWAIATLGERWTFRVLVPPGQPLILDGPYRFVRHPNYVAVVGELVGIALAMHALITGPLATLGFGALILRRIRVENRALDRQSSA